MKPSKVHYEYFIDYMSYRPLKYKGVGPDSTTSFPAFLSLHNFINPEEFHKFLMLKNIAVQLQVL